MTSADQQSRVVVITGASRGLGAGMAEWFLARGDRVGVCARGSLELSGRPGVVARRLDMRDDAAVDGFAAAVVAELGPIDLWINNAGVLDPIAFVRQLDTAALLDHLAINVGGVLAGSRAFVQHQRSTGRAGVLVNLSSGAALKGYAGWGAYCAGKAAVDRLTECIALEEQGGALRAYAVAPGVVDTGMQDKIRSLSAAQFPAVEKFKDLKRREAFNRPPFVAQQLAAIAFDPAARPDSVVVRLPNEPR